MNERKAFSSSFIVAPFLGTDAVSACTVKRPGGEVEIVLAVSPEFDALLAGLADETGDSQGDVLVKSLALMAIAIQAKRQGKPLVVRTGEHSFTEIAGI